MMLTRPGFLAWMALALAGALAFPRVAAATTAPDARVNLAGKVLERNTEAPLAGAMVKVVMVAPDTTSLTVPWAQHLASLGRIDGQFGDDDGLVTYADSNGQFGFRGLPTGRVSLTFPNAGFAPIALTETIRPGERVDVTVRLKRRQYNTQEIVVFGDRPEQEVTRVSLSALEVQTLPGTGGDAIRSVQALPGVARPTMADPGAVIVRGSGNYDTRFLLDGIDIPLLFHFGGVKSTYNSLGLGGVDLYPGGFGVRYGGCIGGLVEVKGRPARANGWHTTVDAGLLDASVHAEGPLGRGLGLMVTARRSFIGELAEAALADNDDVRLAVAPWYADAVARLDWEAHPDHRLFLTFFGARDRLSLVTPNANTGSPEVSEATDEVELDLSFSRYILGYDAQLGRRVRNELRASAGRDRNSGHLLGEFRFDGRGPVFSLRDDLAVTWRPWLVSRVGTDLIYSEYDYEVKLAGYPASRLTDKEFSDLGTYAGLDLRPLPSLLVSPGVRHDYYHHLDKSRTGLRASLRWDYGEGRVLTASAGDYNQAPRPIGQSTDPVYGNPDLPPTTARHLTLGHEWRFDRGWSLKVEGYYNTQDDVPAFADTNDVNFLPDARARMYGLELLLRRDQRDGFRGWLACSVGRSERQFARDPGDGINWSPGTWLAHDVDQPVHLEATGTWDLGRGWSFGSRLQFVTGVPVTPLLSYTAGQFEFDGDTGNYVPVEGAYLSDRVEPYVRVDLRVDWEMVRGSTVWSLYLDLQNANYFAYNSPEGYTYNYDYSERSPYGWIFLPSLGARVEF
ncbi:MAG: TonB-dependent receptor [bacterium]|nr:TonB-dependent receptor [bacterium]